MIDNRQKAVTCNTPSKVIAAFALFLCMTAFNTQATPELTDEQLSLLQDQRYVPADQIEALNRDYPIPLLSLTVSAERLTTNTDKFSIVAVYQSMGVSLREKAYLIDAPSIAGLDFSDAIKKKCAQSPETFFGDMIVNGALGFNVSW
ncbi:hypothetical protein A9Q81_24060 [Gammaproteobacteria bacterium 42_54_T18]|nr:hypothetical protein A9Q81_24060 [Gammaproteobacteria bacterium 42_54_T18]